MFDRDEIVQALRERGFDDVRQRISGLTQFVGGRLPETMNVPFMRENEKKSSRPPKKPAICG